MSEHDGYFVQVAGVLTIWAVDDGKKRPIESPAHMYEIGLRPVHTITQEELDAIPFSEAEDEEE